jgi:hypothetical protein
MSSKALNLSLTLVMFGLLLLAIAPVEALTLPSYAQGGDLKSSLEQKGKAITDILALVATIISIMGMVVGGMKIGGGDPQGGKQWVIGGLIGLVVTGLVYGIASLAV